MPHADGLSLSSRRILGILHEQGDWVTRTELAKALQYTELSHYHMGLLKRLLDNGVIELRRNPTPEKNFAIEYRVKS